MPHAIDHADGNWFALVDPNGSTPHAARMTPTCTELNKRPPVYSLADTWPGLVQLMSTLPGAVMTDRAQRRASAMTDARAVAPWDPDAMEYVPPDGQTPYPWQAAAAAQYARVGALMLSDEPGCLHGGAVLTVNRAGKSFRITLQELVRKQNGGGSGRGNSCTWDPHIPTTVQRENPDGSVRLARIAAAWFSGMKQTYTVTTDTGRTIRATDEHPFKTVDGWRRLDELRLGTRVHVLGGQSSGRPWKPKARYVEVAGLRAHPFARGLGRRTSRYRVAKHRLVVEAANNGMEYVDFVAAVRRGPVDGLAFLPLDQHVHHMDHDHLNNARDNLEVLSAREHHQLHAAEGKGLHVLYKTTAEMVVSIVPYGVEETYDIEVADDPHNFIADGFVVHNTGKTASAILAIAEAHTLGRGVPALVICPASVVTSWIQATKAWTPHLSVVRYMGPKRKRMVAAGADGTSSPIADVLVTSYETAARDVNVLSSITGGWETVVLDEHHMIKSPDVARSKAARKLAEHSAGCIALSGTPITHHPGDLWSTLACLEPRAWQSRVRYRDRYLDTVPADYGAPEVVGFLPHRRAEFDVCMLGTQRRVAKADALPWLPPKVYQLREVDIPAEHRKHYAAMRDEMVAALPDNDEPLNAMSVLSQLTFLQSLSSAPCDVEVNVTVDENTGLETKHYSAKLKPTSWKVTELLAVLDERVGESVVVFSPSRQLVELAGAALEEAGVSHGYVVGKQTSKVRDAAIDGFQAGDVRVLLVTTSAGGVGITLTAARCAVFLSRPWSLVEATQSEDRVHRIGSEIHDSVDIVDIVATDTVDGTIRRALLDKAVMLGDVLADPRIARDVLGGVL